MTKQSFKKFIVIFLSLQISYFLFNYPVNNNFGSENEAVLSWNFMGGSNKDLFVQSLSENANHYIIGNSNSPNLIGAVNQVNQKNYAIKYHGFLICYNSDLDKILYSVYIKGSNIDLVSQMIISGEYIYVIGTTSSPDLQNATNNKINEQSGFITKINKQKGSIIFTSYIGDQNYDRAIYLFDTEDSLFVFGQNDSYNFNIENRPENKTVDLKIMNSFFINSINKNNGKIIYYKRFAETEEEQNIIQVAEMADTFLIALYTDSKNFPLAKYREEFGKQNIVIAEINKKAGKITRATYFGGNNEDNLYQLIINEENFYIFGRSKSSNLLGLKNAKKSSSDDGYISCFSIQTLSVKWSLYIGGSAQTYIKTAKINENYILLTGQTEAVDLPGLNQTEFKNWKKCNFISKINKETGEFIYSTLLDLTGESYLDHIYLLDDKIYILGITKSSYILKAKNRNHCSLNANESYDGFISRIDLETGSLLDSFLFGGELNDYPESLIFDKEKIFIIGDSLSSKVIYNNEKSYGDYDIFITSFKNNYYDYNEFITELILKPESIEFYKYWMNWPIGLWIPKTISITNNGAISLSIKVINNNDWLTVNYEDVSIYPTETKKIIVKLIYGKLKQGENIGSISLSSEAGIRNIIIKAVTENPTVKNPTDIFVSKNLDLSLYFQD